MTGARETFDGWAVLELMGHRRLGGYVREQQFAGVAFIRIDVPGWIHTEPTGEQEERDQATQFYAPAAVYCTTPTTEEIARAIAESNRPQPVHEWEIRRRPELDLDDVDDADLVDEHLDADPEDIAF